MGEKGAKHREREREIESQCVYVFMCVHGPLTCSPFFHFKFFTPRSKVYNRSRSIGAARPARGALAIAGHCGTIVQSNRSETLEPNWWACYTLCVLCVVSCVLCAMLCDVCISRTRNMICSMLHAVLCCMVPNVLCAACYVPPYHTSQEIRSYKSLRMAL